MYKAENAKNIYLDPEINASLEQNLLRAQASQHPKTRRRQLKSLNFELGKH